MSSSPLSSLPHLMPAIRSTLLEACALLNNCDVEYVIAGGWVPYLRGGETSLRHPGTRDVDILFNDAREPIGRAVRVLVDAGYSPSAKHPFQLLKKLPVVADQSFRGLDVEEMVFNIDLMHPIEGAQSPDLFEDIIDLGVKDDYDSLETHVIKSICFPSSRIIFDEKLWSDFPVSGELPNGTQISLDVPLIDEVGLVLSKCQSASKEKRDRDSFDIYFLLAGPNGPEIAGRLKALGKRFPQVADQIGRLKDYVSGQAEVFDKRVWTFTDPVFPPEPNARVSDLLA